MTVIQTNELSGGSVVRLPDVVRVANSRHLYRKVFRNRPSTGTSGMGRVGLGLLDVYPNVDQSRPVREG